MTKKQKAQRVTTPFAYAVHHLGANQHPYWAVDELAACWGPKAERAYGQVLPSFRSCPLPDFRACLIQACRDRARWLKSLVVHAPGAESMYLVEAAACDAWADALEV